MMIKETVQEENRMIVYIYAPNIEAPKYIKQILRDIRGDIYSDATIAGNFKTPLTSMDRSSRQKINKETMALNGTLLQMDLIVISRTFYQKTEEQGRLGGAVG
uniref:Uncharacterized protein n=1 Tax=Felis catus TaxID=9685 RepID=A0ABI7VSU8_FELCA